MKRIIFFKLIILMITTITFAAKINWQGYYNIVNGLNTITKLTNILLTIVNNQNLQPGMQIKITTVGENCDYDQLALKLRSNLYGFSYFLEIWTQKSSIWRKGLEFGYSEGASQGTIIVKGYSFNSTLYDQNSIHKIIYSTSGDNKTMTSYTVHGTPANHQKVQYVIGKLTQDANYQNVYVSAWFDSDLGLGGTGNNPSKKDAYHFGGIISRSYPYNTVAKQGAQDYDVISNRFNFFGSSNPYNAGKFNIISGFVSDGYPGGDSAYPNPTNIIESNLPTYTEMNDLQISGISFYDPNNNPGF